jgi:hypothetical protein
MIAADLTNLGETHALAGALDAAEPLYREAQRIYDGLGDPDGRGFVLSQLGRLALDRQQIDDALDLLVEGLRLRWEAGDRGGAADTLDSLAEVALTGGDVAWARSIAVTVECLRQEMGIRRLPVYEQRFLAVKAAVGARQGECEGGADEMVRRVMASLARHRTVAPGRRRRSVTNDPQPP